MARFDTDATVMESRLSTYSKHIDYKLPLQCSILCVSYASRFVNYSDTYEIQMHYFFDRFYHQQYNNVVE